MEPQRFIIEFTSAGHVSLSWASSIQSIPPHPSSWRSILIYPPIYSLVSQVVSSPQVSPPKPCIHLSSPPNTRYMPSPSHSSRYLEVHLINTICYIVQNYIISSQKHFCATLCNVMSLSNRWLNNTHGKHCCMCIAEVVTRTSNNITLYIVSVQNHSFLLRSKLLYRVSWDIFLPDNTFCTFGIM